MSMREMRATPAKVSSVFVDYLLPVVTNGATQRRRRSAMTLDCDRQPMQRSVAAGCRKPRNQADEPCEFTALIGYEWTATPGGLHWHRNVIFRSDQVPRSRPSTTSATPPWTVSGQALADHCLPENGCDAIAIPHNINWTDGGTFDVENDSPETWPALQGTL